MLDVRCFRFFRFQDTLQALYATLILNRNEAVFRDGQDIGLLIQGSYIPRSSLMTVSLWFRKSDVRGREGCLEFRRIEEKNIK